MVEAQNTEGPAPNNKNLKGSFLISVTEKQGINEGKKQDRHHCEQNAHI
jgi:hypothetical protein